MPDEPQEKQHLAITAPSREELVQFCERNKIEYVHLYSMWRRLAAGNSNLQMADVIYCMALAKVNGLDPFGEWYVLIPRQGGGFSVCFKLDTAYHILSNHPQVETFTWYWLTGKDVRVEEKDPKPSWTEKDVDFGLRAIVEGKVKGNDCAKSCTFGEWVAYGSEKDEQGTYKRKIKPMWLKMPYHFVWKQAVKEFTRVFLGASLPYEYEQDAIDITPVKPSQLPESNFREVFKASEELNIQEEHLREIIEVGEKAGLSSGAVIAGLKEAHAVGMSDADFIERLKEKNKPKVSPAEPVVAETQPPAEPKKPEPKPKETLRVSGFIESITEAKRRGTSQPYLRVTLEEHADSYQVWDAAMFDGLKSCLTRGQGVELVFVLEGKDPQQQFRKVESYSEAIINEPEPESMPAEEPKDEEMPNFEYSGD